MVYTNDPPKPADVEQQMQDSIMIIMATPEHIFFTLFIHVHTSCAHFRANMKFATLLTEE
jgi:hypothetical protein